MNKRRSKYWEILSKNSSTEQEDTNDLASNCKLNLSHKRNSHGDANVPSHPESTSGMRRNTKLFKTEKDLCVKLDTEYIENLVGKIKELKSRMVYFERQLPAYNYIDKLQKGKFEVGDFQKHHSKCDDNVSDSAYEDKNNSTIINKVTNSNTKEHQRSIYTSNEQTSLFNHVKDDLTKKSSNKLNKTNVSIVMSMHSAKKDRNSKIDHKQFQATAEEFIQQAEELKAKIAYILDCCGYNTPASRTTPSVVASAYSTSFKSGSKQSIRSRLSGESYNLTLESINDQYGEILKTLESIDQNVKKFTNMKALKTVMSKLEAKEERLRGGDMMSCDIKMVKKSSSTRSVTFKDSDAYNKKSDKSANKSECKHKHKRKGEDLKEKKHLNTDKLEPVVMVYEPIEPQSGNCKACGQPNGKCREHCKNRTDGASSKSHKKGKKDDGKSQKHGFVVTYTPNISQDSKASVSSPKSKSKKGGLIPCCFGF